VKKPERKKVKKPGSDYRYQAEKILEHNPPDPEISQSDSFSMIHELQVHQVELEMMNDELIRSRGASNTALEKLRLIIETANIGIWEIDIKTDVLTLDRGSEIIFGLKPDKKNYPEKLDDLVCDEDLPHFKSGLKSCLINDMPFETVFRSRNNGLGSKFIRAKVLTKKTAEGNIEGFTGVFFDITGLTESSKSLIARLNDDLLRSNRELQTFAYVASHDLQEPLRMVASFTQLLAIQYGEKLDERAQEYIRFAVDGAKRMYELLNGLLDYSRINTRVQDFSWVDMNEALLDATNNLDLLIREKEVVIKSDRLPKIFADGNQMARLFQNLISNAIKFSESKPYIYVTSKTEKRRIVFMIRDNGIGIEPQYFERIFQIFQRLGPRGKYEGTGIGLAICKNIVERHEGKIWVESEPGKGSTFFFSIPDIKVNVKH
jgi:signal transduction histidine kinase